MEICIGCGKHIHHSDDDCYYCKVCDQPLCIDCVRTTEEPVDNYPLFEWYDYCEEHLPEEDDEHVQVN
jgi:hypothetical protein